MILQYTLKHRLHKYMLISVCFQDVNAFVYLDSFCKKTFFMVSKIILRLDEDYRIYQARFCVFHDVTYKMFKIKYSQHFIYYLIFYDYNL